MLKRILVIAFLITSISASAQLYPIEIRPGETKTVEPGADTLWILKDSQVKKAIIAAKKLQIEEEITKELKKKISLIEEKELIKDSLIIDLKKDRDYYIKNWKDCTNDVDLLITKCRRQKFYTRLSMAGIAVAFIAGFLIAK
ncbi:MAG: hypothetical protein HC831_06420 [Chloroflexia bacterium]|nr:hypothetical protein [Chloroflexia bacterium]